MYIKEYNDIRFFYSYDVHGKHLFDIDIKNRNKDCFEIWLVNVVHLTINIFRVNAECAVKGETMGMS